MLSCVACAVIDRNEAVGGSNIPFLVFTSKAYIRRVNVDGTSSSIILNRTSQSYRHALGIDFDYNHNRLYWIDLSHLEILSSNIDGSGLTTVISSGLGTPERVAYDWITHKLYWTDYGDSKIEAVDLHTNYRKVIVSTGAVGVSKPRAIVLDPSTRYMYWTELATNAASIKRASMDGSSRQILVSSMLSLPNGLTLDHETQTLYFIDAYLNRLERVNTNGGNRKLLKSFQGNFFPFSLVYHNGSLFWTERYEKVITRLALADFSVSTLVRSQMRPAGLTLVAPELQPRYRNPCKNSTCSHICLLSAVDTRNYTCACEGSVELGSDGATCLVPTPTPSPQPSSSSVYEANPTSSSTGMSTLAIATNMPTPRPPKQSGECEITKPCKNGATCVNTGILEYYCVCVPGYEGRYCLKHSNYGVCNISHPCLNGGLCTNLKDNGYSCSCTKGHKGENCSLPEFSTTSSAISPQIVGGVTGGLVLVVGVLLTVVVCVFAMFKKKREKTKLIASATSSRNVCPILMNSSTASQDSDTPRSSDAVSHDYRRIKSGSPSLVRLHNAATSKSPRGGHRNLRK